MRPECFSYLLLGVMMSMACSPQASSSGEGDEGDVYYSSGVHNDEGCDPPKTCIAERAPTDPSDPRYPDWWISDWTMFRVFQNYQNAMPPYTNPPSTLAPGDYQVSYGTTYYDSSYTPKDHDGSGAMMEHYDKYCLPIFPIKNNYSCSFVSLGNKAYFLTYKEDRPKDMPACCLFSPKNHPPAQDFIKHLPYSAEYSKRVSGSVQAYAKWVDSPNGKILFGYAFNKEASPDGYTSKPYRHPQSFYFSGYPVDPADPSKPFAPIVSQNYTSFRVQKPEAAQTWDLVEKMCPDKPVKCQLFNPPSTSQLSATENKPQWNNLQPEKNSNQGGKQ